MDFMESLKEQQYVPKSVLKIQLHETKTNKKQIQPKANK